MHSERNEYDIAGLSGASLYGKRRIGGAIISAGIYVEDQQ
jgi:predicted phage tail protein